MWNMAAGSPVSARTRISSIILRNSGASVVGSAARSVLRRLVRMAGAFRFVFQIRAKVSGRLDALKFQSKCFVNQMVVISDPFHCSGCHLEVEDTWCRAQGMSIALGGAVGRRDGWKVSCRSAHGGTRC